MKLHIKNLGPIKEATIDLSKRFYTFVGYNNTGKTYLANLLYCVFNPDSYADLEIEDEDEDEDTKYNEDNFLEWNETLCQNMLEKMADVIRNKHFPETLNISKEHFILKNFKLSFSMDREEIKRIPLRIHISYISEKNELSSNYIEKSAESFMFKWTIDNLKEKIFLKNFSQKNIIHYAIFEGIIAKILFKTLHDYGIKGAFLPTERISFMYFYKYFFRIEKERREEINRYIQAQNGKEKNWAALEELSDSPYTKAVGDLLTGIYSLNENRNEVPFYQDFTQKLAEIMGGKIVLKKSIANGATNFQFQLEQTTQELKLYTASSSINQLAILYLYWKYWVGKDNNFLKIDEPEQNLHPENQVKITELLIQFANKNNNRVLICTHSPLIAEVINNYLVLGQLENREEAREKLGLAENCFLTPEDTGIYFFTGDKVREYKISDYGTIFEDFKAAQERVWDVGGQLGEYMYHQINRKIAHENTRN